MDTVAAEDFANGLGAYAPVISVAASGWTGEWEPGNRSWWVNRDVADPTSAADFYSAAIPLPAGCRNVRQPSGAVAAICWGDDATGAGLVTVDAALAATP